MRSARNQERGCVFLRLLSPTRKTPASIFRRLLRWCNPCESCPMNHWQSDPRSSLRMRLRILLEGSFVFACCLLPTPCAKMPFCLSAPAHCWKQPYQLCGTNWSSDDALSLITGRLQRNSIWAVFTSKISLSKFHYSPITSNFLPYAWSIKYR